VTKIGNSAFSSCRELKDVTVSWSTPLSVEDNYIFNDITLSGVTLHVPAGTEPLYRAAPVWKDFKLATSVDNERIEPTAPLRAWTADGILHISGLRHGETFCIYTIQGQLIYKGIARTGEEEAALANTPGVYILSAGERRIKILY
jgi:hypothetical protein